MNIGTMGNKKFNNRKMPLFASDMKGHFEKRGNISESDDGLQNQMKEARKR
jgi:hypothetical protein